MDLCYIVKKGDPPGSEGAANLGGICVAWLNSPERDTKEVIVVSGMGGVNLRLTAAECEKIAHDFLRPKIR